jgi:HEAT repeat protein
MGDALQAAVDGIGEPALGRLAAMLAGGTKDQRRFALDTLPYMEGADKVLVETLRTGDDDARSVAVAALGDRCQFSKVPNLRVGDAAVLETLVSMMAGNQPGADQAMHVLTQTQDPQLIPMLRPCLKWSDAQARRRAILALAAHGDPSALPLLLEDARSAGKTSGQSLWMLSDYDDDEAVRALVNAASTGEDNLRASASYGLANLATRENASPANRDLARATLRRFLSEGDADTRALAANAFAAYGMDDADGYFRAKLVDPDWHVRHQEARVLGMRKQNEEAVSVLVADLEDKAPEVRKSAAGVLRSVGGPEAVEPLRRALKDSDLTVRAAASAALLQVKLREARRQMKNSAQGAASN